MHTEEKRYFRRDLNILGDVARFVKAFISVHEIDAAVGFFIDLAVEELFTNMVKYNPDGSEEIEIGLRKDETSVQVIMVDLFAEEFDVTRQGEVDVKASLHERHVGGLGLHLVQRMMDEVYYEYKHHQSKVTLIKKLPVIHA